MRVSFPEAVPEKSGRRRGFQDPAVNSFSVKDFRSQLEAERPYLLRYARLQLRERHAAEDAVQEALLAALAGEAGFGGRSNLRTWLTGILKHKIVDAIRRLSRETTVAAHDSELDALFDQRGHWIEMPAAWDDPDAALEQKQFFAVLEECLTRLPAKTAQVFMMREHLGYETGDICKEVGVTPTHCWVLLYRARVSLRECLQQNWFAKR
jgi:RNA polymerase sigma-70 factor, ECF subfamily